MRSTKSTNFNLEVNLMIKCWKYLLAMLLMIQGTAWAESELDAVRNNLKRILPQSMEIKSVEQTAMEGVYLVVAGSENLFVHSLGDFVMIGEVYDTVRRISLTQERKDKEKVIAMKELSAIPESEMIIMGDPQGERYVTVFTDTDCGWCQKFHKDIPVLEAGGLKVRYMMWPRAGINSESYDEAVSVWCAEDQGAAMTVAKNRQTVEPKVCENPVKEQYALGFRLGVQGTPFIMLDNGEVLGGYVDPDRLLSAAELK
jgi:thiol:disulfide interchange protein DsbC